MVTRHSTVRSSRSGNRSPSIHRIGTRLHTDKGTVVHLAPDPEKLHLFSTSTEERLTA